ncbi:hypothetical protein BCY86_04330 [Pajaroellobacter abortibovis]|uniref:Uncharacterized protein n=1 Tax=Pajaroellobacter abortibovis TaxID=1882918 RepID=A0A1L6MWS9_9BACT|nr:hypothetical protein BCY86_04330 [Pajaroellobacter abortibovis]
MDISQIYYLFSKLPQSILVLFKNQRESVMWPVLQELLYFLWIRKKYWLYPILFSLVAVGILLIYAQGSVLSPFIYAIF